MRPALVKVLLAAGLALGLAVVPGGAAAQRALVYCPINLDRAGCDTVVAVLAGGSAYPGGVDRGYDGTGETVDLRSADLFAYSVFVVPSLADDSTSQPYAFLRDSLVVEHLRAALIGGMAALGLATPTATPGLSLDAVGATGTTKGGQVVLATLPAGNGSTAGIATDKRDYAPGDTVIMSGHGWTPGETVTVELVEDPLLDTHPALTAVADSSGKWTNSQFSPDVHDISVRFIVTATGGKSGMRAQTTFTEATQASDGAGTMTVSPGNVTAGQTGVTLTFTFTAPNGKDFSSNSTVKIVVPSRWTTPQTSSPGSAGYVRDTTPTTCTTQPSTGISSISVSGNTITVTQSCLGGNAFTLKYGNAATPAPSTAQPDTFNTSTDNSNPSLGTPVSIAPPQPVVTVNRIATTTALASGPNPSTYGQSVSFTAAVSPSAATGTVTFYEGSTCTGTALASAVPVSGGTASFSTSTLSASSHTILACYSGDATYNSSSVTAAQTVNQASQTIAFTSTAPSNAVYNGPTYPVAATASSGLAVTFGSSTPAACMVSGSTVSFVGVATCTVTANQAGNANYAAAAQATQTFPVGQASQTITFTSTAPSGAAYNGPTYSAAATA